MRRKVVGVIGSKGSGKKHTVLSLYHHLFVRATGPGVTAAKLSSPGRELFQHLRQQNQFPVPPAGPAPAAPPPEHSLEFDWEGDRVVVKVFPTGTVYPNGGFDAREVSDRLAAAGVDVTVWTGNPHTLFPAVAAPAFERMLMKTWAVGPTGQPSAFTFAEAVTHSARLTFGKTPADLGKLAVGFATLSPAVQHLRLTQPHRTRELGKVLLKEGVSAAEAAAGVRFVRLLVDSCSAECGEVNTARELLALQPHMLCLLSHYDLSGFCGVPKATYEEAAAGLFPDDRTRLRSDLILGKALHFELQAPPLVPVLVRDVPADCGELFWGALKPHLRAVPGRPLSVPVSPPAAVASPDPRPVAAAEPLPQLVPAAEPPSVFEFGHDEQPSFRLAPPPPPAPWYVRAFRWATATALRTGLLAAAAAVLLLFTLWACGVERLWAEGVAVAAVVAVAVTTWFVTRRPSPAAEMEPESAEMDLSAMFPRKVSTGRPLLNGKHA